MARPAAPASHHCSSSRRPAAFTSGRLWLAFRCTPLPSPAVSVEKVRSCRGLPSLPCPEIQAAVSATATGPPRRCFSAQVAAHDAGSAASGARRRALPSVRHLRAAHRGLTLAEEAGPCGSAHLPQGHPPFYRELIRSYRWTTEGCPPPTPAVQRLAPEASVDVSRAPGATTVFECSSWRSSLLRLGVCFVSTSEARCPPFSSVQPLHGNPASELRRRHCCCS